MMRFIVTILLLVYYPFVAVAQTCLSDLEASTPTSRFETNSDGSVTDLWTELVWARCPVGYTLSGTETADMSDDNCAAGSTVLFTWSEALALSKNADGEVWRVPNIKELASLVERSCYEPAINEHPFPLEGLLGGAWSSSPFADATTLQAWSVLWDFGTIEPSSISAELHVRLVRGVVRGRVQ